jgi:hypothetical protein
MIDLRPPSLEPLGGSVSGLASARALLLLGSVLAGGCSDGVRSDPCEGVTCSFYGLCISDGIAPFCSCERGFHPENVRCVPNNPDDPCDGVRCNEHGTCRVDAGYPICDCEPGYYRDRSGMLCLSTITGGDADADTAEPEAEAEAEAEAEVDAEPPNCEEGAPDGTPCEDGHGCTTDDRCITGVCTGNRPDGDGDGHFALGCLDGDDCDDAIFGVNPGRAEGPVGYATCFDRLDNDCDTLADLAEVACGVGLDLAMLESPTTISTNVGTDTPIVRCRAYEPGSTEPPGAMPGLLGRIGYGPHLSDPTDNPAWTWVGAEYFGQGGPGNTNDVFAGFLSPATGGAFSYTCRFSTDGGAAWVYADLDGNGAAPPGNGLQVDSLGTLYVVVNDHLVVSEVVVVPAAHELVEIHNPTGAAVDLSSYYLTDSADQPYGLTWRYWDIVTGSAGPIRGWDFVVRFPDAASIDPAARIVVGMRSAADFRSAFGRSPDYELCPGTTNDPTVPDMVPAFVGATGCHTSGPLGNAAETLVLFRWSGTTDLVQDVDIFQWGDTTEAMCKTGISRDGPDAGATPSTYLDDTPIPSQRFLLAPHSAGGSFERTSASEPGETRIGGNGITGHDETSEDFPTTWRIATAASPGS